MIIKPILSVQKEVTKEYFMGLGDRLKYRFPDIHEPNWEDMKDVLANSGSKMFFAYDRNFRYPVLEFTFDMEIGRNVQAHFSVHPDLSTKRTFSLMKEVSDEVLQWGAPNFWIDGVLGLIPMDNKVGWLATMKAGFTKVGVLPSSINYFGGWVDAMILIKRRPVWEVAVENQVAAARPH